MWIVPGDAAIVILAGEGGEAGVNQEDLDKLRKQLGPGQARLRPVRGLGLGPGAGRPGRLRLLQDTRTG